MGSQGPHSLTLEASHAKRALASSTPSHFDQGGLYLTAALLQLPLGGSPLLRLPSSMAPEQACPPRCVMAVESSLVALGPSCRQSRFNDTMSGCSVSTGRSTSVPKCCAPPSLTPSSHSRSGDVAMAMGVQHSPVELSHHRRTEFVMVPRSVELHRLPRMTLAWPMSPRWGERDLPSHRPWSRHGRWCGRADHVIAPVTLA